MPSPTKQRRRRTPCDVGDIAGDVALEQALDGLEEETPDRVARAITWLRDPAKRPVRLIAGVLFILGGVLSFLPILGIEMLPIGLLLIAMDFPALRKPVGRTTLWLECQWARLSRRWRHHHRHAQSGE